MLKKSNKVHLEGLLENLEPIGTSNGFSYALAGMATLHERPGAVKESSPSERYAKIHHELRIVAGKGSEEALELLSKTYEACRKKGEPYSCCVDGHLFSDGNESYVVCKLDDLKHLDKISTSGNNRVNINGDVVSTSYTNETATIRLRTDEGVFNTFVLRRQNQSSWDMVADGKISKGDSLSISGPLLSNRMTDGKKTIRFCQVSPRVIKKLPIALDNTIKKKGSISL